MHAWVPQIHFEGGGKKGKKRLSIERRNFWEPQKFEEGAKVDLPKKA